MEQKLKALFDFQKLHGNERLARMIAEAEQRLVVELDDDKLSFVAAAGELYNSGKEDRVNGY